jgi:hypothetical protein
MYLRVSTPEQADPLNRCGPQVGDVRRRYAGAATISAIADAVRWAEMIMEEIDKRT